jgi:short-subunit dehydrogenase
MPPSNPPATVSHHKEREQFKKWVLITGASTGIGRELARCFARAGFPVILTARDEGRLRELSTEIETTFRVPTRVIAEDLAEPGGADRLWSAVSDLPIDVLINNAGFGQQGLLEKLSADTVQRMVHLNILALTELTHRVLPGMRARKGGRILQVASTAAFQPGPRMALYYATKAFVLSLSEALDEELRGTGIQVTALCPGPTATEFSARADMTRVRLFNGPLARFLIQDARTVAEAGFLGCLRGRRVVIPGLFNRLGVWSARHLPRTWVTRLAGHLQSQA